MSYAKNTRVGEGKSKDDLERILLRYGADGFAHGWQGNRIAIEFQLHSRRIRFELMLPDANDPDIAETPTGRTRSPNVVREALDAERRRLWRALVLVVKAKLEAVKSGISTVEQEFLAWTVLRDGRTVGETVLPALARADDLPKLLGGGGAA